jgi:hypothetical protein
MRTTIPNDRCILLPTIVFRYVPVHNATESLRWDSETDDKTTAANQHLEQSKTVMQPAFAGCEQSGRSRARGNWLNEEIDLAEGLRM